MIFQVILIPKKAFFNYQVNFLSKRYFSPFYTKSAVSILPKFVGIILTKLNEVE